MIYLDQITSKTATCGIFNLSFVECEIMGDKKVGEKIYYRIIYHYFFNQKMNES